MVSEINKAIKSKPESCTHIDFIMKMVLLSQRFIECNNLSRQWMNSQTRLKTQSSIEYSRLEDGGGSDKIVGRLASFWKVEFKNLNGIF